MSGREITLLMKFDKYTLALYDDSGFYKGVFDDNKRWIYDVYIEEYFARVLEKPEDILQHIDKMACLCSGSVFAGNTCQAVFIDFNTGSIHRLSESIITNQNIVTDLLYKNPKPENIFWQDTDGKTIYKLDNKYFDMCLKKGLENKNKVREVYSICKHNQDRDDWEPIDKYFFNGETAYKYLIENIPEEQQEDYFVNSIYISDWEDANVKL